MNFRHARTDPVQNQDEYDVARTRLHGYWLVLAQIVSPSIAVLALGLFFAAIPLRLHELLTLSHQAERSLQQLTPGFGYSLLHWVLSVNFYPISVLTVEITLVSGFVIANILILWHGPKDWRVMAFCIISLTYVIYIIRPLDAFIKAYPLWRFPADFLQALGLAGTLIFFYIFPNGRFVPSWTRPLAVIWIIWTVIWLLFPTVPFNFSNPFTLSFFWFVVYLMWWFTGILAQLYRYHHISKPYRQQQIRWVVFSITFAVLSYAVYYLPRILLDSPGQPGDLSVLYNAIGEPLFFTSLLFIPLAYLFSIFRYHMFDIKVIINLTLVYGTLTAILVLVYFSLIFALQYLLRGIINQNNDIAIVISTLAIAALFQPLRHRIQRIIDRRFYRRKYNAAKTVEAFSATLRNEVDLNRLREHLLNVVQDTMQPAHMSLWLRSPQTTEKHQGVSTSAPQEVEEP